MSVRINFPPEIESTLRREAAAAGQDVETFVRNVVAEFLTETSPPQKGTNSRRIHGKPAPNH